MSSEFWRYFHDILRWPLIHSPGPLSALARGQAASLDETRDDILYFRQQWFPEHCEDALIPGFGASRGLTRHPRESAEQFRARVVNAWRWHLLGGKVQGLPEILKFYGFEVLAVENMRQFAPTRWAEFMVRLKTPESDIGQAEQVADIKTLIWLVNEYKPARSYFFRLYNDSYDRRPITLSIGPRLGSGWLSYWSGVTMPDAGDSGTIISFGLRSRYQGEQVLTSPGRIALSAVLAGRGMRRLNAFLLGKSRLSDTFIRRHSFVIGEIISLQNAERVFAPHGWSGPWSGPWVESSGWTRIIPAWRLRVLGFARSQLVPGHRRNGVLGSLNGRLGAVRRAVAVDDSPILGDFRLSLHGPLRRVIPLLEYRRALLGFSCPQTGLCGPHGGLSACFCLRGERLDENGWQGPWSGPWTAYPLHTGFSATHGAQAARIAPVSGRGGQVAALAAQAERLKPEDTDTAGQELLTLHGTTLRHQSWSGPWGNRKWWDYTGQATIQPLEE